MSSLAIKVHHLVKEYKLSTSKDQYFTLRDTITSVSKNLINLFRSNRMIKRPAGDTITAINNISFDVEQGEIIGIIGKNGAGKSSLLKVLSRITKPTRGFAITRGNVGSMLEVGTGFHLELTGRENIFVNGAILGMSKKEIDFKFDEIVDFSGVEKFLDMPVKRFSSGMRFRLAFAVAAHLHPDILLVDEVLAVGDYAFQKKCLGKMGDAAQTGRTVLFVSHNMNAILQLCSRTLVMDAGKITFDGKSRDAVEHYINNSFVSGNLNLNIKNQIEQSPIDPIIKYSSIFVRQYNKLINNDVVMNGDDLEIEINYEVFEDTVGLRVFIDLIGTNETLLFRSYHDELSEESLLVKKGIYTSLVTIPKNMLAPKEYEIRVMAEEHNKRICLPEAGIRIPITVEPNGLANRAYMTAQIRGELAPVLNWYTKCIRNT
ncbi:MAG: ABC transporter ATP-binding protein [Anaerolineaceae bacterium]|nr:ABC transporter ATP-binding protein [Anaerolineaceae bacterium]